MKCFFLILLALGIFSQGFAEYTYLIQPRSYLFSTHYDIYSEDAYIDTIEKSDLQLHRVYSLCDEKGAFAKGTARLFSMGALFDCMKEIDVEDIYGQPIGFIQGEWWTTASGKFTFYDQFRRACAIAFIDRSGSSVSVVDPMNQRVPIAIFRRTYVPKGDYFWEIKVVREEAVDPRTLHIFSAFITDICWPSEPPERNTTLEALETAVILRNLLDD